jgi:hypothetical protein
MTARLPSGLLMTSTVTFWCAPSTEQAGLGLKKDAGRAHMQEKEVPSGCRVPVPGPEQRGKSV